MVVKMKENIKKVVSDWQLKELDPCYVFVYVSKEEIYMREKYSIKKKELYTMIGINVMGMKRVIGLYIEDENNNHYWMNIFEKLKHRGLKDILFLMVGMNKKLKRGAKLVFDKVEFIPLLQEIIDNSTKYIARKHFRELSVKLRCICIQETIGKAEDALSQYKKELLEDDIVRYVIMQYEKELLNSYKYPLNLRKQMYSMSFIDTLRRKYKIELKKVGIFENVENLLFEMLKFYINIEETWVYSKRNWNDVINLVGKNYRERIYLYL